MGHCAGRLTFVSPPTYFGIVVTNVIDLAPVTLMHNEYATLWFHPDGKILHHRIEKYPDSETFRALLNKGAECMEYHHAKKWLSDDQNNYVIRDADEEWGQRVWQPRVLRAGFKYWAVVNPAARVGQLNMARLAVEFRKLGVTVRMFGAVDEAMNWLRAV